ncbi:MAG: hypothetical protein WA952_14095 [Lewinella sp.]
MEKVQLLTNPGGSAVTLTTREGMFPALTHLACYSVDGRLLGEMGMEEYTPATPIHLPDLPVGIHLIVVTDGVYRKTLRYVKTY